MTDYIHKDAAIDEIRRLERHDIDKDFEYNEGLIAAMNAVAEIETEEVAEIVRCNDCRYFNKTFPLLHLCNLSCMKMEIDAYCSYGERKDG